MPAFLCIAQPAPIITSRSPARYAAAAISNTDPGTLIGHFTYVDTEPDNSKAFADAVAGAPAWGAGLPFWLARAPAFASDKITAPILFSAGDPWHLIEVWQLYASLREQGKPVELQYIRGGQHNLRKIAHVHAHQEMLLDWFDFWLNDHEDPNPAKTLQYGRWRTLKRAEPADGRAMP
jgi:hypothetical protein